MNTVIVEKVQNLLSDDKFISKLNEKESFMEIKDLFGENGVELSEDELKMILNAILVTVDKSNGEISETELENVNGGIVGWVILGVGAGIVGGVSAYKLRKALNNMGGTCK